jgi:hypothetical protein
MNRQQLKALLAANDARLAAEAARVGVPDTRGARYRRKSQPRRSSQGLQRPDFGEACTEWEKTHSVTKVLSQFGVSARARVEGKSHTFGILSRPRAKRAG